MLPRSGATSAHSLAGTSVLLLQVPIRDTHLSSKDVVQKGVWGWSDNCYHHEDQEGITASPRDLIIPLELAKWERQRRRVNGPRGWDGFPDFGGRELEGDTFVTARFCMAVIWQVLS